MNPPQSVDDLSLLQHEPLSSYLAAYESRSASRQDLISRFVTEMQREENKQAAAAAKRWAHLLFKDTLPDNSLLEPLDGGKVLYERFFGYQHLLSKESQHHSATEVNRAAIVKRGLVGLNLRDSGGHDGCSTQPRDCEGRSSICQCNERSSCSHKTSGSTEPPNEGICSGLGYGLPSTMGGSTEPSCDTPPPSGIRPPISLEVVKPSKRAKSKKKNKRKASSQKPPAITLSDASEDDKEQSKTQATTPANSVSHRSKRVAASPSGRPRGSLDVKQVDKGASVREHRSSRRHCKEAGSSQSQPPLPGDGNSHCAESPPSGQKQGEEIISNDSAGPLQMGPSPERPQKMKPIRDIPARMCKRLRRGSALALDGDSGEGSEAMHDEWMGLSHEDTIVNPRARKKRTRLEFEVGFMLSHESTLEVPREPLGPDPTPFRPLPRKVCSRRFVLVANDATTVREETCRAQSPELENQLTRDITSDEPVGVQVGLEPHVEDWTQTQDEEHEVGYNYLTKQDEDDEDEEEEEDEEEDEEGEEEASDIQVTTTGSAPTMVIPKPPVPARPGIWARSRQEVCESLDYFRCYHGGVYCKDDIVRGYLLGGHAASRDAFHHDGKLVISHGGGKSESILEVRKGVKRYQTDQDQEASDKSVRALLKTHKGRRPVVLLADDKYALFPYDLISAGYTYVVLGLYWISHAWAERQFARDGIGRIVRWKFAFQWCEGQGDPWWWVPQEKSVASDPPKSTSNSATSTGGEPSMQCENCQGYSPFVYRQGWMCLNPRCDVFWSINDQDPEQLDYREEFLTLLPQKFERLPKITPTRAAEAPDGVTTTYAFSRGWHCRECGRLSCRFKWEHWECANCHLKQEVNSRIRSPKEFWHLHSMKGFLHSQVGKDSGILARRIEPISLGEHKGLANRLTFVLPRDRGQIHLVLGTPLTNDAADNIFQLYQQQASTSELKLHRYPLHNHRARGLLLTNYFSQNSGEPYQYVGGSGNTVPFDEAPECVRRALALIKERSRLALGTDVPFNEILTAAYMERQKMSFHSDNEKGLGPIVASLSLGSAALMHFRPHANTGDPRSSPYALSLILRHGDVLVMEGDGVQKYYEHTVLPMNFRIAATARCIESS